jgi:phage FluMu protein Com
MHPGQSLTLRFDAPRQRGPLRLFELRCPRCRQVYHTLVDPTQLWDVLCDGSGKLTFTRKSDDDDDF